MLDFFPFLMRGDSHRGLRLTWEVFKTTNIQASNRSIISEFSSWSPGAAYFSKIPRWFSAQVLTTTYQASLRLSKQLLEWICKMKMEQRWLMMSILILQLHNPMTNYNNFFAYANWFPQSRLCHRRNKQTSIHHSVDEGNNFSTLW